MGCGASNDKVQKDPQYAAEPISIGQKEFNDNDKDNQLQQGQVIKINGGGHTTDFLDDYKKSPTKLTQNQQRGLSNRNNPFRNSNNQIRNNHFQDNSYTGLEDIEEMTLQDNKNNNNNNINNNNNNNDQHNSSFNNNQIQHSPLQSKSSPSKVQLNGFHIGNGYNTNRRQNQLKTNRSKDNSLSSESFNELNSQQQTTNLQINNKTSHTNISGNLIHIQEQSQTNDIQPKTFNLFQMKKISSTTNNNNNNNIFMRNNILEKDSEIEDLSLHLLENNNNNLNKQLQNINTATTTIDADTPQQQDIDNDPLFKITELKQQLQKTQEYLQYDINKPSVLSHEFYKPNIDFTKENEKRSFNKDGIFNNNFKQKIQQLDKETIENIKNLLFGNNQNKYLPKSWNQGFIINENDMIGLIQKEGGPCGIIAVVQAYMIKYQLFILKESNNENKKKKIIILENCVLASLAEILYKCRSNNNNETGKNSLVKILITKQSNQQYKAGDINDCSVIDVIANKVEDVYNVLKDMKEEFIGQYNQGIINLLYSVIATKKVANIISAMDLSFNSLIGLHGHATQELVNLLLCGEARSNCFDGMKELGGQMKLYGIKRRQQIGFLSGLECEQLIEIGQNYKNPYLPIWVICKENHYTTLFAKDSRIIYNTYWNKFDLIWYDQLSEQNHHLHKITIQKQINDNDHLFFKENNDAISYLNKNSINILHVKWGNDITIDWNGQGQLL